MLTLSALLCRPGRRVVQAEVALGPVQAVISGELQALH